VCPGEVGSALEVVVCFGLVDVHRFLCIPTISVDSGHVIFERKAAGCVVSMNHSGVSFYCSRHICIRRKLKTPVLVFLDLGTRFHDQMFHFLH